jgi:uncharacterized protein YdaU (DUF1376 family)
MIAPWFKFFAGDYLNDPDVDDLSLEAQGILVRMWSALWMYGSLPSDVEEMARKCKVRVAPMHMHLHNLLQFFVQQADGTYISERQERERQRSGIVSKARQKAANAKWSKRVSAHASAHRDAKADANGDAQSMQSEVRGQRSEGSETKTVAPLSFSLLEAPHAQPAHPTIPKKRNTKAPLTSLPENFGISERVKKWARESGHSRLQERLEDFVGYCRAKGAVYADWDAAFMNAIREDWAQLNGKAPVKLPSDYVPASEQIRQQRSARAGGSQ